MMPSKQLAPILTLLLFGSALGTDDKKIVDLTHVFDSSTIYWPTAKPFQLEQVAHGRNAAGFWYASNDYAASEHGGTHMDAPVHFAEATRTADQIPLSQVIGESVVVDVSEKATNDRNYRLTVDDVLAWESKHGKIPEGAIFLLFTGWGRYWKNRKQYLGTDLPGDTEGLSFPGFSERAALFLVAQRGIKAAGLDTPSLDYGRSKNFSVHRVFARANIPGFENIANLDRLPPTGAAFFGIPMKIGGGTGAPTRLFAFLP